MAEVDVGSNTYDSFADIDYADEYLAADILRAASWAALSLEAKGRALVSATRAMLALPWCDTTPDPTEAQAAPIPEVTTMLAADLAANPKLFADASGDSNVKRAKAGSAEVEFFSPIEGGPPLPRALWDRLLAAGLVCLGVGDSDPTLDGAVPHGTSDGCRPLGGRAPWEWYWAEDDYG